MLFQDQQKIPIQKKHLSCQNHLPQPWRSFHCYWNTNFWHVWGYEVSSSILWVKFLGSHTRTRKSIQSPNWRYVGWILKAEHTLFGITHKIIHVGMHSYINLTNKYPIVFAITHRYSFPSERGQTVNAGAMWGCVPTPTCSCPPISGPAYTLTRFSSHCCYYLGQFQV